MELVIGQKEAKYKVLLVGDSGVGKSSMMNRLSYDKFTVDFATIGIDFAIRRIQRDNMNINLQFWDNVGQEHFTTMSRVYQKNAVAAFIMVDVTRNDTLEYAKKLKSEIDENIRLYKTDNYIPIILIVNKIDVYDWKYCGQIKSEMDIFCVENGFYEWFAVSVKDDININQSVNLLVDIILKNEKKFAVNNSTEDDKNILLNYDETCASDTDRYFSYSSFFPWGNTNDVLKPGQKSGAMCCIQ